ncbi:hypothetical protein HJC23_002335 [Cyclotella cryptica]|uniref:Uncharacterized protein n=1 Tax=Cyclotella cryptica TaxID=29204 RepID=A0ABD3QKU2_9STRA|eukprot:CCRYP_004423-RA/>CCRYP_004423-RA protein AED:0.45 eAED:0.45 QI:0/-1/0/1/-1/1/1/0/215
MTKSTAGSKRKREVQVVVCPSAFPDFTTVGGSTSRQRERQRNNGHNDRAVSSSSKSTHSTMAQKGPELDVQETIREVHKFGAMGFTGSQAKQHQASEYERITGRSQKRQKIPTKMLVGMRKKAMKREERQKEELKESGVVSHHSSGGGGGGNKKKKRKGEKDEKVAGPGVVRGVFGSNKARNKGDRRKMSAKSFGPAPSVGFMTKGMLKVKQPGR